MQTLTIRMCIRLICFGHASFTFLFDTKIIELVLSSVYLLLKEVYILQKVISVVESYYLFLVIPYKFMYCVHISERDTKKTSTPKNTRLLYQFQVRRL